MAIYAYQVPNTLQQSHTHKKAAQQHEDFVTVQVTLRIPPTLLNNVKGAHSFVIDITPGEERHPEHEALATVADAATNNVVTTTTIHIPLAISSGQEKPTTAAATEKNANPQQGQRIRAAEEEEQHVDLFDDEFLSLVDEFNSIVGPGMEGHSADADGDDTFAADCFFHGDDLLGDYLVKSAGSGNHAGSGEDRLDIQLQEGSIANANKRKRNDMDDDDDKIEEEEEEEDKDERRPSQQARVDWDYEAHLEMFGENYWED
ncbi:unnamed protein product [Sordaria macrospora k-hell]|uniref:WGS project CABT00000000 data, contig 2.64 n=2 Tax=Sordaria macrospora TaxID=5147 RepID=F7WAP8_SORMK|nr:uncharacterized protein SMAC_08725 [Sordaria macrospora k-hell]CCC05357.1 unnamed protein product [Sordaria macrospora k-hell]